MWWCELIGDSCSDELDSGNVEKSRGTRVIVCLEGWVFGN
jgi:hypothetical protein